MFAKVLNNLLQTLGITLNGSIGQTTEEGTGCDLNSETSSAVIGPVDGGTEAFQGFLKKGILDQAVGQATLNLLQ